MKITKPSIVASVTLSLNRMLSVLLPLEYVRSEEFVPQATDEKTVSTRFDSYVTCKYYQWSTFKFCGKVLQLGTEDGLDHIHHVPHEQSLHEVESLHPVAPAVIAAVVLFLSVQVDGVEAVDAVNVEVGGPRHEAVVAPAERDLGPVSAIVTARPRPRGRTDILDVKVGVGRDPAARVWHM